MISFTVFTLNIALPSNKRPSPSFCELRKRFTKGAAVAYWLGRRIQDRNEDFVREFDSRWWIFFQKLEFPMLVNRSF